MFLVDKYYQDSNSIFYHQDIVNKILNSFDSHIQYYNNYKELITKPTNEIKKIFSELYNGTNRYASFQHLILYGSPGSDKEYIVNKLLERVFDSNIKVNEVEYQVSGYSNTKTKILIKQSKYHIIIEPNSNGFDKYLIQEIIQEYAKSEILDIMKNKKLFKIVVINKIDNLSYYAQASLRRTMEKYSSICKFILISEQLSKIIEPIRSRCLLVRVPLPNREQILETLLYIINKESIEISFSNLNNIINKSENKINQAIWLLEMYRYNITYDKNWEQVINNIISLILNKNNWINKKLYALIKKIREMFYILFITNIPTQLIIRKIMIKLLNRIDNLQLKYNIIDITSIYEQRLSQGTRHIIHLESYIIKLIALFSYNIETNNLTFMNVLEI